MKFWWFQSWIIQFKTAAFFSQIFFQKKFSNTFQDKILVLYHSHIYLLLILRFSLRIYRLSALTLTLTFDLRSYMLN
jgi:hypothetical protein